MVAKRPYWSAPRCRQSNTTTTKTASLATARAPTTSMLLRSVVAASRSVTGRIVVEFGLEFVTGLKRKDRKSTRLNSSHDQISYAVFCLKKKKQMRSQEVV